MVIYQELASDICDSDLIFCTENHTTPVEINLAIRGFYKPFCCNGIWAIEQESLKVIVNFMKIQAPGNLE